MQHKDTTLSNHVVCAMTARKEGNYREAIAHYKEALKLDPTNATTYRLLGSIYLERKQFNLALAAFNQAINLNPTDATAYHYRGFTQYSIADWPSRNRSGHSARKKHNKAIADFTMALSLKPTVTTYLNRASIYNKLGRSKSAIADCKEVLKLAPTNKRAYHELERAYAYRAWQKKYCGRIGKAIAYYVKVLKLNPKNNNAATELEDIFTYQSREQIFAHIKQLPKNEMINVLKEALTKNSFLNKKFRQIPWVFFRFSVKRNILSEMRNHLISLKADKRIISLKEKADVTKAAQLIAQGQRDPQSMFFKLPTELGVKIASAVGNRMPEEKTTKIAKRNFDFPKVKKGK